MSTRVGSQDTPPNLGVLGGNGAHLPVPVPWVKVAFGGEFISSPPVQGRQGGGSGGSRPPEPGWGCCMWPCVGIGGDGTLSTTTNWGALLLCPPHQEPLRVSWGVVGEGWVLSLHPGVLRGPDTPTSGWAQHCRLLVRMG